MSPHACLSHQFVKTVPIDANVFGCFGDISFEDFEETFKEQPFSKTAQMLISRD